MCQHPCLGTLISRERFTELRSEEKRRLLAQRAKPKQVEREDKPVIKALLLIPGAHSPAPPYIPDPVSL